ncbi:MAG: M23 family peptidase, partial [Fibrobacteraceae bacterium]|nr:M23 family peptidase [Fibrobacteraceae bacterium]
MKRIFLFYIVSVLVVLLGCGEDEKIKALQEEQRQLISQKDSLSKRQSELEKSSDLTLVSDTVKAGNGLFQVLERMGLSEEERRVIVLSIQVSVEL